jgi:small subunit ribosomal protein S16
VATRIRLSREGRKHSPFYHIGVYDIRQRRNADYIDRIGTYDPTNVDAEKQVSVDSEKAAKWLADGAVPSETVKNILKKAGVDVPSKKVSVTNSKKKSGKKAAGVKERTKKRTASSKLRKERKLANA